MASPLLLFQWFARVSLQSMVTAIVMMVREEKSPASKQLIKPPSTVFARAPAKVRQGDTSVQGFVSFPARETHVLSIRAASADCATQSEKEQAKMKLKSVDGDIKRLLKVKKRWADEPGGLGSIDDRHRPAILNP
jgi:hypothetical protein